MASEQVKTQEDNNQIYIQMSKKNIDDFILKNDFKKAFSLLILVLERLDDNEKCLFIDYYSEKLNDIIISVPHLDNRRFFNCNPSKT